MTREETGGQTPFEILKGEPVDINVKEFQKQYGYERLESNIYGKEYQQKRIFTGIILSLCYLVYAGACLLYTSLYVTHINDIKANEIHRLNFEDMTPIFPNERLHLERPGGSMAMRITDLVSPIGKGQRGMIVSPPKAGKTTLLKDAAKSILKNNPEMHLIILLIDERPEEVRCV